jgi:hypothetical protein
MGTRTRAGAWSIDFPGVSEKAPAGGFKRCLLNLNSHNHNQHAGRPCFSLAVQIERSTSTPRCDISRLRKRGSHVSAHAIHAHADCSPLHRSTTAKPSSARCKQSARPATRMTIGRHCMRRPPHDLLSWACRFYFRSSFNRRSTTGAAELRICANFQSRAILPPTRAVVYERFATGTCR